MIVDAYTPTVAPDFFDVRVISDSGDALSFVPDSFHEKTVRHTARAHGLSFFKGCFPGLESGREYTVRIVQGEENGPVLHVRTPEEPEGRRICTFGILTDLHIAYDCIRRPDSGKRLYGRALPLARKYAGRLKALGAEFIVLPGDTLDPASETNMHLLEELREEAGLPFYAVLGNHEGWGRGDERRFNQLFCFSERGYYAFSRGNTRFVLLSTPDQSSLYRNTEQYTWLSGELEEHGLSMNVLLFLHFSLVLHPCVRGYKNDGLQQLHNYRELLDLLKKYRGVKAVFAGHKNVPSLVMRDGIAHVLSPQLIQAPCGYDLVTVYEDGLVRTVYEIDEQEYVWQSRTAFGAGWDERYGTEDARNFRLVF